MGKTPRLANCMVITVYALYINLQSRALSVLLKCFVTVIGNVVAEIKNKESPATMYVVLFGTIQRR